MGNPTAEKSQQCNLVIQPLTLSIKRTIMGGCNEKKESPKHRAEIASRLSNRQAYTFEIHALLLKNISLNEELWSILGTHILFIKNGYSLGKLEEKQHLIIRVLEQSWQFNLMNIIYTMLMQSHHSQALFTFNTRESIQYKLAHY